MGPSIVLVEPLIPQNTGTIARLTAATGTKLHLIEPLGFELSDRYLKRAGLDYWPEVDITVHKSWNEFLEKSGFRDDQLWFITTKGETSYTAVELRADQALVFGNESRGFAQEFHDRYADRRVKIPMDNPRIRSLNLSNAVSIVLYEARRQLGL
ncbi:MAG: tRNA (cytidine(34)-2'-O)-methyltransferase [Bdellovibrionota bacterium]